MSFFEQLQRRNVIRVGIAYAAVAWLLAQIADLAFGAFDAPDWALRALLIALVVGFPIALVIAWIYEVTPDGIRVDTDGISDAPPEFARSVDRTIIAVMAIALVILLVDKFYISRFSSDDEKDVYSIAVLPFENLSDENDHFADGLSEELLNLLARNKDLSVAARTSSFSFKDHRGTLVSIGDALNVDYVLEGSVRRAGDRLRITANLVEIADGYQQWSRSYDRKLTTIFDIQDEIAQAISQELKLRLVPDSQRITNNFEAYALYLESMAVTNYDDIAEAIELLRQAVALDPDFAKAYERLALAYWLSAGVIMTSDEAIGYLRDSAERALAIDPTLVVADVVLAATVDADISWIRYLEKLEAAVAADPQNTRTLDMLAGALQSAGYFRDSLSLLDRYMALDPLSSIPHFQRGRVLGALGQREASTEAYLRAVELGDIGALGSVSFTHIIAGEIEQGIDYEERFREHLGEDASLVRGEIERMLDPDSGKAYLDNWIEDRVASHPYPAFAHMEYLWYLPFGYTDQLWDKIREIDETSESAWSSAEDMISAAISFPQTGFRRHPNYVTDDKSELWDYRGAPDTCNKVNSTWICQ